ncbi:tRNA (adenosine(37)-N6)-threonylcarbamoyltransferase complex dimerization subunit type 1 TsaB [Epibacterium ulvae]|uniref:tRNA (adenosine(37)-N6)-threonylcarbamoyltransferase complex dimerization subunit type 1 TsaB n=1 Tax=Epibacterium ulvae TaxID=1156985 RepID=UPI001BFC6545|nr:tRNA (adenosine(37)-N6)-threonylcarbamoyltransferase complex dimerization subunit type 1 TsaB [Epibacterium ulvae]MBT8154024.1 tRNA (adenosine(37)-N6)-threonylcarbamoyltransferase complex dimerization subunit type 1 TsaB [Epibacterium ulvae]
MPRKDPKVLAFDTSAAHCAAAVLCGGRIVAERLEPMTRGQAERLMVLLEEVLTEAELTWTDLDAIGVGVGPGNFTGIRISVSAARGLALGLGVPAVGVNGFESRAQDGILPAIPAPRDHVYIALPDQAPRLLPVEEANACARGAGLMVVAEASPEGIAARIAQIAASRATETVNPPAPLYLKPADAAPSKDKPPALLDD